MVAGHVLESEPDAGPFTQAGEFVEGFSQLGVPALDVASRNMRGRGVDHDQIAPQPAAVLCLALVVPDGRGPEALIHAGRVEIVAEMSVQRIDLQAQAITKGIDLLSRNRPIAGTIGLNHLAPGFGIEA